MKLRIQYLVLFSCFGYLPSFGQSGIGNTDSFNSKIKGRIDSIRYTIIPFDTSYKWLFSNAKPAQLTIDDVTTIDNILGDCVANYNPPMQKLFDSTSKAYPQYSLKAYHYIIDLSRYNRQYIPVINEKGEKEVWVNCICDLRKTEWRNQIITVRDGGNCYFNLKINLTLGTYYALRVNGEA